MPFYVFAKLRLNGYKKIPCAAADGKIVPDAAPQGGRCVFMPKSPGNYLRAAALAAARASSDM